MRAFRRDHRVVRRVRVFLALLSCFTPQCIDTSHIFIVDRNFYNLKKSIWLLFLALYEVLPRLNF